MNQAPKLEDWTSSQADGALAQACVEFARFMNGARPSLDDLLTSACSSTSQTRAYDFVGSRSVAGYFASWVHPGHPRTFAELANEPESGKPCLLMSIRDTQLGRQELGDVRSYLLPTVDEHGLIDRITAISYVPSPFDCRRSGIYPGLDEAALQHELGRTGPWLSRFSHVELLLFAMPPEHDAYARLVFDVARELRLPPPRLHSFTPEDPLVARLRIDSVPTLKILRRDRTVRTIQELHSREDLVHKLSRLFGPLPELARGLIDVRPDYFAPPASEEQALLRRIKGTCRRDMVQEALESQALEELPVDWTSHSLTPRARSVFARLDPAAHGGEELPDLHTDEVEIARRVLYSMHCEVVSLRARPRAGAGVRLRMVGEDEDVLYTLPCVESDRPLDALEVLELFRDATPCPIAGPRASRFRSDFYPQLGELARVLGHDPQDGK